jgi:hypothetical protein
MSRARPVFLRISTLALGLGVGLATSGCVAAGLATGPLMSAVQLIGDRTVERTVAAELAEAQGVTEAALMRMGFRIEDRERNADVQRLQAVADHVTVHARFERVTARLTRVGIRVEAGKLTADRDTAAQVQEQIAAMMAASTAKAPPADPAAAEALSTLQGEIHKLRSDIEARRSAERPVAATEKTPSVRLEAGAVVTIPMSAALPTVGGPAPPVSVPTPVSAPEAPMPSSASSPPELGHARLGAFAAAPLHPAEALTPIGAAVGVGTPK